MRNYGTLKRVGTNWVVEAEPHVLMMMKRLMTALGRQHGALTICDTRTNCELLEWFQMRYPLEMTAFDRIYLEGCCRSLREDREQSMKLLSGAEKLTPVDTKLPLRDYQVQAVRLLEVVKSFLCGDDLGLGKTCVALGAVAAGLTPAIVLCQTHLQQQWVDEALKFLPGVIPHVVKKGSYYRLPKHNLLIITYSKLKGWADYLNGYQLVAFDEAQELRRNESQRYGSAMALCEKVPYRLGLTATPIYNYGDEIFNVVDLLRPGSLGSRDEFLNEWCIFTGGRHWKVRDPRALGSHLAENHLFLRRRRHDVGRELPDVTRVSQEVEYDTATLFQNEDKALDLARAIVRGNWQESGQAALELNAMMRMQTGLAKAPYVVNFVRQLVESGEAVVLAGWHREVYQVWERLFEQAGIPIAFYTGEESPSQKIKSAQEFIEGRAEVLVLSLRSGAGLNGLQKRASLIVFGELDWSPQVHEQCIGRLNRDGQDEPVTAIYLYAAGGSDPVVAMVLGVKKAQASGIVNPKDEDDSGLGQQAEVARGAALAREILGRAHKTNGTDRTEGTDGEGNLLHA